MRSICNAGDNLAMNWMIGFRLKVSSLRNNVLQEVKKKPDFDPESSK
jgi:hypothetical protein